MGQAFGVVREVTIWEAPKTINGENYRGQVVFMLKDKGLLTLKIGNDDDFTFMAQVSVLSSAIQYGQTFNPETDPNVHITWSDEKLEINDLTFHWHYKLIPI